MARTRRIPNIKIEIWAPIFIIRSLTLIPKGRKQLNMDGKGKADRDYELTMEERRQLDRKKRELDRKNE